MRVRLSKIEVRCASVCEKIIKVRLCVRHTVKILATQRLIVPEIYTYCFEKERLQLWLNFAEIAEFFLSSISERQLCRKSANPEQ